MPAITFDPATFKIRFPEFGAVADARLGLFFDEATLYLSNTDSPVQNEVRRGILFGLLTAHVAYLAGALSADGQARPVGRIASASEGSVSASFEDAPMTPGTGAWFRQSQYGAAFWQATAGLRGFMYVAEPTRY